MASAYEKNFVCCVADICQIIRSYLYSLLPEYGKIRAFPCRDPVHYVFLQEKESITVAAMFTASNVIAL
jgi:hypothetical protein